MRVNLGSGHGYMQGWVNVDGNPDVNPDVCMDSFDFVREHGHEVTELYMGHFLEHLLPASAVALLALDRRPPPGGCQVSAVVPDMRAVFAAYDRGELSNEFLNERFIYSYEQPSHHVWCYDVDSLRRVFEAAGYDSVEEIDPLTWDPVFWKEGPESRWQCGLRATVPTQGTAPSSSDAAADDGRRAPTRVDQPVLADELLLQRIQQLRGRVQELESLAGVIPNGVAPPALSSTACLGRSARWRSGCCPMARRSAARPGSPSTRPVPRVGTSTSSATTSPEWRTRAARLVVPALAGGTQTGPFLARRGACGEREAVDPSPSNALCSTDATATSTHAALAA